MRTVAWARTDGERGHGFARLTATPTGWSCEAAEVLAGPDDVHACTFRVDLDADWRTVHAVVEVVDAAGRHRVELTAADGRWTRDGADAPDLDGCTDVDVAATPLTNTFPIRRLAGLPVGETATLAVAWVEVPTARVHRVTQRYTRLAERRWRYGDDTYGDFELRVDDDGIVVDYAGFATRVWP